MLTSLKYAQGRQLSSYIYLSCCGFFDIYLVGSSINWMNNFFWERTTSLVFSSMIPFFLWEGFILCCPWWSMSVICSMITITSSSFLDMIESSVITSSSNVGYCRNPFLNMCICVSSSKSWFEHRLNMDFYLSHASWRKLVRGIFRYYVSILH